MSLENPFENQTPLQKIGAVKNMRQPVPSLSAINADLAMHVNMHKLPNYAKVLLELSSYLADKTPESRASASIGAALAYLNVPDAEDKKAALEVFKKAFPEASASPKTGEHLRQNMATNLLHIIEQQTLFAARDPLHQEITRQFNALPKEMREARIEKVASFEDYYDRILATGAPDPDVKDITPTQAAKFAEQFKKWAENRTKGAGGAVGSPR